MRKVFLVSVGFFLATCFVPNGGLQAQQKKPVVLQYEYWLPPKSPEYPVMQAFYKGLEDATGGAVKVQFNPGGVMGKPGETYQRVLQGVTNIGHFNPGFNTGVFPMWEMFEYPIHYPLAEPFVGFQLQLYEKGYFNKEFANVKISALFNIGPYVLFSNKKIKSIEDLRGVKIRTIGDGWVDLCKVVGAVPVSLPTGEMFLALQKGIVDAVANVWDAAHVFKLNEVSKFVNELNLMSSTHIEAWNKKSWEALPPSGKNYINGNWKKYSLDCARKYDELVPKFQKEYLATGPDREIIEFAPGELEKLDKLARPIWEKWIAAREAKGLPAKKALNDLYKAMSDAGIKHPIAGYTP